MFSLDNTASQPAQGDLWDSLSQLRANTPDALLKLRTERRIGISVPVVIKPGDASRRHTEAIEGITGDMSVHGCQVIVERPIWVGDLFWLEFDNRQLNVEPQIAVALRCVVIGDMKFETGFKFMQSVDLSRIQ
ncbi:MAG: PilZ domain-containing protein [Planctomycetales bacterium]|nr:PilZ domain-containing protein [Planctomycetales bacterium]